MNAKIMTGKSAGGLIAYLNDMEEKNAKIIFSNGVSTTSNQTVVTAFNLQWANASSKIKDRMGHLVISFSPKDHDRLTDELVSEICSEYMQRMKFPSTIYVGYRHYDHEHDHVHIAYSRIDNQGKAIKCDSNFSRSVKVCKALREKYGLAKPSKRKKDVNRDRLYGKDKVKYKIMDTAFPILDRSKSWKDFLSELEARGIKVTMVRDKYGSVRGIVYTADRLSFAGRTVDSELAYGNLRIKFGNYEKMMESVVTNDNSTQSTGGMSYDDSCYIDHENGISAEKTTSSELVPSGTEFTEFSDSGSGSDSDSSIGSGIIGAAVELVLQPHQAPISSVGGSSSNDDDRRKDKDKDIYVPRRGRRR